MFKKNYLFYTVVILFSILMVAYSIFSEMKNKQTDLMGLKKIAETNGIQDRTYWSDLLYKISYPVIHNLSEGTLKRICLWRLQKDMECRLENFSFGGCWAYDGRRCPLVSFT